jgi:transposase
MYAREGRESIPPERPLRALVLQSLYSIRSERQLCASNSPTTCSMAA